MQSYESRNIYCEGFIPDGLDFIKGIDLELRCDKGLSNNNLSIDFKAMSKSTISQDELAFDLVRIASYVYIADCKTERGGFKNAYDEYWNMKLNFYIPVINPDFWNKNEVKELLSEALNFAVGHIYNFEFSQWSTQDRQLFMNVFSEEKQKLDVDCISMFSGGLDSLYNTLLLLEENRKPLLISHKTTGKLSGYRKRVYANLKKDYKHNIPRWEINIKNYKSKSEEYTQRSRSIVYACLGTAFAKCLSLKDVYLSDNGTVTFNLRSSGQNIGTLNTRSTNPKLIEYVNKLSKLLWKEKAPVIQNKLLWFTKAEVVKGLKDLSKSQLMSDTISCVSTKNLSTIKPYCGVCSQCIDRRFATEWSSISDNDDPRKHYQVNIFTDDLTGIDKGIGKTHAENYYRKAEILHNITENEFLNTFNEIYDFIPEESDEIEFVQNVYNLHKRFAKQALEVIQGYWLNFKKNIYPENCLVSTVFRNSFVPKNLNNYSIPEKEIIINTKKKKFVFKNITIDLTVFEFDFLLILAKEPDAIIEYEKLMTGEIENQKGYSTPAHTHRRNINKKIIQACNENNIAISNKFSITKTMSKLGYKLNPSFENEVKIEA